MQHVLLLPRPLLLLIAALFVGACLGVACLVLSRGRRTLEPVERHIPVPAFMGVVATAWALSLGFTASDLWSLGNRTDQIVAAERSAVMRLLGVAAPSALDVPDLHDDVIDYVRLVESGETGHLGGDFGSAAVDAAIQNIRVTVIRTARSGIPDPIGAKIVNDFDELQDARNARLGINVSVIDPSKWYLLLSLTFITTFTVALLHIDRPGAGRIASAIFSITALSGFWILIVHVDPFSDIRDDYLSYGLGVFSPEG